MLNNKHQTIRQGKTSRNLIKSQQLFFIVKIKQMTSLFWNVVHNKLKIYERQRDDKYRTLCEAPRILGQSI